MKNLRLTLPLFLSFALVLAGLAGAGLATLEGATAKPDKPAVEEPPEPPYESHETGAWPQFGCDPGCTFSTPGSLPAKLAARWVFPMPSACCRISSAIMQDDRVYVAAQAPSAHTHIMQYALDRDSGKEVWKAEQNEIGMAFGSYQVIVGDLLFLNDSGLLRHDRKTGAIINRTAHTWGLANFDPAANLLVTCCVHVNPDNGGIWIGGQSPGDYLPKWKALNESTNLDFHADDLMTCSLAQGAGKVFAAAQFSGSSPRKQGDGLYALQQADGTVVWTLPGAWGSASFDGRYLYAAHNLGPAACQFCCLDPADGKTVWSVKLTDSIRHPPALSRGVCVAVSDNGALVALATEGAKAGKALWQGKIEPPFRNWSGGSEAPPRPAMLAIASGAGPHGVLVAASDKVILCLDLRTGKAVQELPWDAKFGQARDPVIANGWLVVSGNQGVICYGEAPEKPAKAPKKH
jgi:outer membrane protein assembly factor BamB